MKKIKKHKFNTRTIIASFVAIIVFGLSFGWSAFHASFTIGASALVRITKEIRVTNFTYYSKTADVQNSSENYSVDVVEGTVDLPYANSTITYEVEVTNMQLPPNVEMGIASLTGLPENLRILSITDYTLKEKICDNVDPTNCGSGAVKTFKITIGYAPQRYDANETLQSFSIDIDFKEIFDISYVGVSATGLPATAASGDNVQVAFSAPFPTTVTVSGNSNYVYNGTIGYLNITNVTADLIVTAAFGQTIAYFKAYNADNDGVLGLSNASIKTFQRNTTATLAQVLAKAGVMEVQNDVNDGYLSTYKIYIWQEGSTSPYNTYWWTEADEAYFHPDTKRAFRNCTEMTSIDLDGANTGLVTNFSNWFDKDAVLVTISGQIVTTGLQLPAPGTDNFNYATETNNENNNESGQGLSFMFNDCKKLKNVDLLGFDTHNAVDMKRMFGNCQELTAINLSAFDTSNVRSMFWMFRNTKKLTNLDLSTFDTSNVENMWGMFVGNSLLKTVTLGPDWDTSSVRRFDTMFSGDNKLEKIYAKIDFNNSSMLSSGSMFYNCTSLVGEADNYTYAFNSSETNFLRANIARAPGGNYPSGRPGYFTYISAADEYSITYNLNGGTANNPDTYLITSPTFTLNAPTKPNCTVVGWIGSNGNIPQSTVTIETGSFGNKTYTAIFTRPNNDPDMSYVFRVSGQCVFKGSAYNIENGNNSNCVSDLDGTDYTVGKYIDTGVMLYSQANYQKDFELNFNIDSYSGASADQDSGTQQTFMNSKNENGTMTAPGMVFRRYSNTAVEVKQSVNGQTVQYILSGTTTQSIKIIRLSGVMFYSVNGGSFEYFDNMTNFNEFFNKTVWFGCSYDQNYSPMRYIRATLSNMYIKLDTSS